MAAVAKQPGEQRRVVRRRNDEDVADAREHQGAERVIDHRLVIDREQLLRDDHRHRMKARPLPAGQNDALAANRIDRLAGPARG